MHRTLPRPLVEIDYYDAAQRYLRSLPPEHFMEAMPQGTQRRITLASLELVHVRRPDIQYFNEMLVQYPRMEEDDIGQVVPDNMVVVWREPLDVKGSYDIPLQPVEPFWVLEYVSRNSKRKDYSDNFDKYEHELKVPYFLLFDPEAQDLRLYCHTGTEYAKVAADEHGRLPIPELELSVAILDGWVRFWLRGELLPLPGDLLLELEETKRLLVNEKRRADRESQRAEQESHRRLALEETLASERDARAALERELERMRTAMREGGIASPERDT